GQWFSCSRSSRRSPPARCSGWRGDDDPTTGAKLSDSLSPSVGSCGEGRVGSAPRARVVPPCPTPPQPRSIPALIWELSPKKLQFGKERVVAFGLAPDFPAFDLAFDLAPDFPSLMYGWVSPPLASCKRCMPCKASSLSSVTQAHFFPASSTIRGAL